MQSTNKAPFTLGMEIEQMADRLPHSYNSGELNWHRDGSGPQETDIGGPKTAAAILKQFFKQTRDNPNIGTWDWHSASARSGQASGCGSHVHLGLVPGVFEDDVVATTIAYNTVVELAPFFAPFWCHDWERGFRHGTTNGYSGGLNIEKWAKPMTTRVSPSTMSNVLNGHRPPGAGSYPSVRANSSLGDKPFTAEIRMNDAHPTIALTGLLALRRFTGSAIERGDSVKLSNRDATLSALYDAIYAGATQDGLMTVLKRPLPSGEIRFEDGRGIPRVDQLTFETPFDVLKAILHKFSAVAGTFGYRVRQLILSGEDENSPANNAEQLWTPDIEYGEFAWANGPADKGYVAPETGQPTIATAD